MSSNHPFPKLPKHFCGKWHKKAYVLLAQIGKGANGTVYLVEQAGKKQAVKIGNDAIDLLMEVNMLKSVQRVRDVRVGPLLCDVDDVVIDGRSHTFYAMEYLEGERLDRHIERVGGEWVPVLLIQLLARLEVLHSHGWAFGDLKPENIMVTHAENQVRLIDFGGVSKLGNAVRQFTEEYDRASWHAGDRRAEVSYDLFALAMVMMRLLCSAEEWKRIRSGTRQIQLLCDIIRRNDSLYPYRVPLLKAFHRQYATAQAMKHDMLSALRERTSRAAAKQGGSSAGKWIGGLFVASLLLLAGSLYYAWF
jgi:serine/threonine-protein kinase